MSFQVIAADEIVVTPMQSTPTIKVTIYDPLEDATVNVICSVEQAAVLVVQLKEALASPLLDFAHTNPFDNPFAHGDRVRFEFSGVTCEGQIISIGDDGVATIGGHGRNYEMGVANLRHVTAR